MNTFESSVQNNETRKEQENNPEKLSSGWKAMGAISLGLLLGGKFHKLGPLGGGLDEKEIKEMEQRGGWLKSVISKTTEVYSGIEKIEDIAVNHYLKTKNDDWQQKISETETEEERNKMQSEYEKWRENIENKKKEEQRIKETREGIFNVLADIVKK